MGCPTSLASLILPFALAHAGEGASQAQTAPPWAGTVEQRVDAQRAIERVYWSHRTWPEANPGPKPPLEAVLSDEGLRSKALEGLKKTAALIKYWDRAIAPSDLQAELRRMARRSKDPAMLAELWGALGNDARAVGETLARPILADRLIRHRYDADDRFHGAVRERARAALAGRPAIGLLREMADDSGVVVVRRRAGPDASPDETVLDADAWSLLLKRFGAATPDVLSSGRISDLQEDNVGLHVLGVLDIDEDRLTVATISWRKVSFEAWWADVVPTLAPDSFEPAANLSLPSLPAGSCASDTWSLVDEEIPTPSTEATSVWTGSEMIVWGGTEGERLNSGGRYNPATDTWTMTPLTGAPTARAAHTAIWTGSEMIVWGGRNAQGFEENTGGRFNPVQETWTPTGTVGLAFASGNHTAVWTGTDMIVWGGRIGNNPMAAGARYSPALGTWAAVGLTGSPVARSEHVAVWTGSRMIVWGGQDGFTFLGSGERYDPVANSWAPTSPMGAPAPRQLHTAVWTGNEMIVWGGTDNGTIFSTGGRYDPVANSWTSTSLIGAPAMWSHTAVWTGSEMIVWGGAVEIGLTNSGRIYRPSNNTWMPMSSTNAPVARYRHTAVWTGTEMIVWGGEKDQPFEIVDSGGRYRPSTDSWLPTPESARPPQRSGRDPVWTGAEMIGWGGRGWIGTGLGGRYDPATDTWTPTSLASAPAERTAHTAVWTGSRVVIWGGNTFGATNTGGRYDPIANSWSSTSLVDAPQARFDHAAVWTGSRMVVWGGSTGSSLNSGGVYDPALDSWTATSVTGAPSARVGHTLVWTGSRMVAWGGWNPNLGTVFSTGGLYDPSSNTWVPTSTTAAPVARVAHVAVWTGSRMLVHGGNGSLPGSTFGMRADGGAFDPVANSWTALSTVDAPTRRDTHSAVWTGSRMLVWGGQIASGQPTRQGGAYDPAANLWLPIATDAAPMARIAHGAVWAGSRMIVWGGGTFIVGGGTPHGTNTGGAYCPCTTATPGPVLTLKMAKSGATMLASWQQVADASNYDAVRGFLIGLRVSLGDYSISTESCLAGRTSSTSFLDADEVSPNFGYFYLVRARGCGGKGTYDDGSSTQAGLRDAEIAASFGPCP